MTTAEHIERINKRNEENRKRTNILIDKSNMAYKIKDCEDNIFCFAKIENGAPLYRGIGGDTHIFDLNGFTVIQKYI